MTGGTLTYAKASFESPHGTIKSSWKKEDTSITYEVAIPAGTTATMIFENGEEKELGSGTYKFYIEGER